MNILDFTAEQILSFSCPEKLFSDQTKIKEEYHQLSRFWHPDKNPKASPEISAKINLLYAQAEKKLSEGSWEVLGVLVLELVDKKIKLKYNKKQPIPIGVCYIGDTHITYVIPKENKDLVQNHVKMTKFSFADNKMKEELSLFLPKTKLVSRTKDGEHEVVVMEKTEDLFSLRDVLEYFKSKIPPVHMAWMMTRILNIVCFFKYNKMIHGDVSIDSIFVSPEKHFVAFLGGFFYAEKEEQKLKALPARTISLNPSKIIKEKIAVSEIDVNCVKSLGLEMLGDVHGSKLLTDKTIPEPLFKWLRLPGSNNPFQELNQWKTKVLIDSFGKRKYVHLSIKKEEIYPL